MKTKIITLIGCILSACMLTTFTSMAQQPTPENTLIQPRGSIVENYTYKVFKAPNKMYGYDIFKNDKIIFHQGASFAKPNNLIVVITKKEHAEKAALLAIEKIKKHEPPALTQKEIKKIVSD